MKPNPRAFTIVEALLATALLAILAAASAGLLRDAARLVDLDRSLGEASVSDTTLLALYADLVLDDPEGVGLIAAPGRGWDGARIDVSSHDLLLGQRPFETPFRDIRITVLIDQGMAGERQEETVRAWLVFSALDRVDRVLAEVARRVRLHDEDER